MELRGTVLNVVDFGAFVDVGLSDSGLIHISQLSAGYVRDPHDVVAVGDQVRAWVSAIDPERRRVALTMIAPGTERPQPTKSRRGSAADARTARSRSRSRNRRNRPKPRDRPPNGRRATAARDRQAARRSPRSAAAAPQPRTGTYEKRAAKALGADHQRRWKRARSSCAPSATCLQFHKKKEERTRRFAIRQRPNRPNNSNGDID